MANIGTDIVIPQGFVPVVAVETTTSGSRGATRPPPTPVVYADPQDSIRASALPNGYGLPLFVITLR